MISKLNFPKLRNGELVQFLNDALNTCKDQDPEKLKLTVNVANLGAKVTSLNNGYKANQGSNITEELEEYDSQRDNCVIGIRGYAKAYTHHYDAAMREAAIIILASFTKYGKDLAFQNYETETSNIEGLTSEWTKDSRLASAIIKLNLTEWAAELKRTNNLFNTKYLLRTKEKGSGPSIKFAELRRSSIESYKELVSVIEANAVLTKDGSYNTLISILNTLIDGYNQLGDSHSTEKDSPSS
jgi:hypothetical protein